METAVKIIQELRSHGAKLTAENGNLHATAPAGAISNPLGRAVKAHKLDILRILAAEQLVGKVQASYCVLDIRGASVRVKGPLRWADAHFREEFRAHLREVRAVVKATGTGNAFCVCGAKAKGYTSDDIAYCSQHERQCASTVGAVSFGDEDAKIPPEQNGLRCPVCLSAGHTTPGEWCDVPVVHSCRDYPSAGSAAPLPAPADTEYEPGADWQPGEEAPGDTK